MAPPPTAASRFSAGIRRPNRRYRPTRPPISHCHCKIQCHRPTPHRPAFVTPRLRRGRQLRPFIVSPDPSSSVPTLHRQPRPLIVRSDSSSSAPTLHRQPRLFCVRSDPSSSAPTPHRQLRPLIVRSDPFFVSPDPSAS